MERPTEGRTTEAWAEALSISRAAVELYRESEVFDLHIDSFIWRRLFGYDLQARHGHGLFRGCFYSQVDLPRVRDAELGGALWIITTNPLRTREGRRAALLHNIVQLTRELEAGQARVCGTLAEYRAARADGAHAALLGVQGGNALELSLDDFDDARLSALSLVTLLHFTRSRLGAPALPKLLRTGDQRLTPFGADYVRRLNERRILVDLAHLSEPAFWDVLAVHDRTQPLTISHAACAGVHPHFRNVSDAQALAVARTGGTIGVIFNTEFLGGPRFAGSAERIVDHIEYLLRLVGPDHVSLGSDFDGAIIPPRDLRTVEALPRLVELMLRRGISEPAIRAVLGQSFLRVFGTLRPGHLPRKETRAGV